MDPNGTGMDWPTLLGSLSPEQQARLRSMTTRGMFGGAAEAAGSPNFAMAAPAQALAMLAGGAYQGGRQAQEGGVGQMVTGAHLQHLQTQDAMAAMQAQREQMQMAMAQRQQQAAQAAAGQLGSRPEFKGMEALLPFMDPNKLLEYASGGSPELRATIAHNAAEEQAARDRLRLEERGQDITSANTRATLGLRQSEVASGNAERDTQRKLHQAQLDSMSGGGLYGDSPETQMLNQLAAMDRKVRAAGGSFDALSPDEQARYRTYHDRLTAPQSYPDAQGNLTTVTKPLSGYVEPPPQAGIAGPAPGSTTVRLPGGGVATTTPVRPSTEKVDPLAGMLTGAIGDVGAARKTLLNPDGSVNHAEVFKANPPLQNLPLVGQTPLAGGVPFTTGTETASQVKRAAGTILYLRTGKVANDREVEEFAQAYLPQRGDSDANIKQKLDRLEQDLKGGATAMTSNLSPDQRAQLGLTPSTLGPGGAPGPADSSQPKANLSLSKADVDATAAAHGKTPDEVLALWAKIHQVDPAEARRLYEQGR